MAQGQGEAGRGRRPHVASGGVWLRRLTLYTLALLAGPAGLLIGVKTGLLDPPRRQPPPGSYAPAAVSDADTATPRPAASARPTATASPVPTPFASELEPAASPSLSAERRRARDDGKLFEAEDAPRLLEGLLLLREPGQALQRRPIAAWEKAALPSLPSGTEFRFRFRFDQPVYLYLFNVQPVEGRADALFPHPQLAGTNPLPAREAIDLPDTDPELFYRLDPLGPDRRRAIEGLLLVYAGVPQPRLEALADEIARRSADGATAGRLLLKRFAEEAERPAPGKAAWRLTMIHVEPDADSR